MLLSARVFRILGTTPLPWSLYRLKFICDKRPVVNCFRSVFVFLVYFYVAKNAGKIK